MNDLGGGCVNSKPMDKLFASISDQNITDKTMKCMRKLFNEIYFMSVFFFHLFFIIKIIKPLKVV